MVFSTIGNYIIHLQNIIDTDESVIRSYSTFEKLLEKID